MTSAYITDTRYAAHTLAGHPEYAGRLIAIQELLDQHNIPARMKVLTPDYATMDQLRAVHTEEYLVEVLEWSESQRGIQIGPDTYVLPHSFSIAKLSAGAAIRGVDAVMTGEADNALAAARPPGHHATPDMGMGFCLLGNIAIAARHAQKKYGLSRVLIVDYDVHHGNGTQDSFYSDPSVLFISTHQSPWYPGTGAFEETGAGNGIGATMNIPLPAGVGDTGFAAIYEQLIWPAARRFQPELILVSAGFDAHWADQLGQIQLSLPGYSHLTKELIRMAQELCGGKIVFVLEGGYNLTSLSHGVLNVAHALLGEATISDPLGMAKNPETDALEVIQKVKKIHGL